MNKKQDFNDSMQLELKSKIVEKFKDFTFMDYYMIINLQIWKNFLTLFEKFLFVPWDALESAGGKLFSDENEDFENESNWEEKFDIDHNYEKYSYLVNEAKKNFPGINFADDYYEAKWRIHDFLKTHQEMFDSIFSELERKDEKCQKIEELFLQKYDEFEDEGVTKLINFQILDAEFSKY